MPSFENTYENGIKFQAVQLSFLSFKFASYRMHLLQGYTLILYFLVVLIHLALADIHAEDALDMVDQFFRD